MRVMAESAKILHTDKNFVYKVLGKYLRITDTRFSTLPISLRSPLSRDVWKSMTRRCRLHWMKSPCWTRGQKRSNRRK